MMMTVSDDSWGGYGPMYLPSRSVNVPLVGFVYREVDSIRFHVLTPRKVGFSR